jgi:hypothetical protein
MIDQLSQHFSEELEQILQEGWDFEEEGLFVCTNRDPNVSRNFAQTIVGNRKGFLVGVTALDDRFVLMTYDGEPKLEEVYEFCDPETTLEFLAQRMVTIIVERWGKKGE